MMHGYLPLIVPAGHHRCSDQTIAVPDGACNESTMEPYIALVVTLSAHADGSRIRSQAGPPVESQYLRGKYMKSGFLHSGTPGADLAGSAPQTGRHT